VGDGLGRTVDPVELGEGVQLNRTVEDFAVEGQDIASGTWEMQVWRGVGHTARY
jgi:hypothetical protein